MRPLLAFDAFTLAAVAAELRHVIAKARVQKVQQPSSTEIILQVYGRTGAHRLLICADPKLFRIHLTQVKRENPVHPPGFCQVCRKYLEGAVLEEITQPRFDRVLNLIFRAHDGERVSLIVELMGRNSNLVLTSGAGVVRGSMRSAATEAQRPLLHGHPYVEPPGYGDRRDPLTLRTSEEVTAPEDAGAWSAFLTGEFSGIGRLGAEEIVARASEAGGLAPALLRLMTAVREEQFAPHSVGNEEGRTVGVWAFAPLTVPAGLRFPRESINVALDTFYAAFTAASQAEGERELLSRLIAREVVFREKELISARATLAEASRAEAHERAGNNLLAQLTRVERGATSVTLDDLYSSETGATITLTLDPKRSPQENVDAYFARARKARDSAEYAAGKENDLQEELALLRGLAVEIERYGEREEVRKRVRASLREIIGEARVDTPQGGKSSQAKRSAPPRAYAGHRIRTFEIEGYTLLVGENADSNDYLTTRVASPTDLWLHVRASAGAHGVLRTGGQPGRVPDRVLRRAAQVVAARSSTAVKHSSLVAVDVTEKRYVRKPRGAKPGMVQIERERVLEVSPETL